MKEYEDPEVSIIFVNIYELFRRLGVFRKQYMRGGRCHSLSLFSGRHYQPSVGSNDSEGMRRNGRPEGESDQDIDLLALKGGKMSQVTVRVMEAT